MFSSKSGLWATPQDFFDKLNEKWDFDWDVCATADNAKCDNYFSPEDNALEQPWEGTCFMNPPYGREIGDWIEKAHTEVLNGVITVVLLPARTDTKWFHDFIYNIYDIEFIKGRLKFGTEEYWQWVWRQKFIDGKLNKLYGKYGQKNSAPFPSMIVIFKP